MIFEEWKGTTKQCEANIKALKDAEKLLNERGYLFASEIGWPINNEPWTDGSFTISEICEDGTVLLDFDPCSDDMLRVLMLGSKLERKFRDLEERIEMGWV